MGCSGSRTSNETGIERPKNSQQSATNLKVVKQKPRGSPQELEDDGEVTAAANRITRYYKNQQPPEDDSAPYTDPLFPPNWNSVCAQKPDGSYVEPDENVLNSYLETFPASEESTVWLRASEIFPDGFSVFEDKL